MFRAVWSKSLRDYRTPILGWGIGLSLLMIIALATATPSVLAGYAAIAQLFRFIGDAYAIQTPEGYVSFRYLGLFVPVMLSFWLILAGSRMVRGEEERGSLDVLLATPQPRTRLLLEKIFGLLLASLLITLFIVLGIVLGEASIGHVDVVRAILTGLNLCSLAFLFGMAALLISQFTINRSTAVGITSGLLLLMAILDISGREVPDSRAQYLSPFHYYLLNRPIIPGFPNTPAAALVCVGLSVLCAALSFPLFARRDIGRAALSWQLPQRVRADQTMRSLRQAERSFSTRSVSLHTLSMQGQATLWWLLGIAVFCIYIVSIIPSIQKPFYQMIQGTPWIAQLFFDTPTSTNSAMLGTILFTFMPVLVVIFAFTLALSWSSDLENGRMELVFSTPNSRQRFLLERFGMQVFLVLLAPVLIWLAIIIEAQLASINIDQGRIAAASFSMFPPALIMMSLAYALARRIRYTALLTILTVYLVLAFLEETFEGMFQMPTWVMSLSIFHLYGNPLFLGMNWGNFLGMIFAALALLLISIVQFRTADIEVG